MQRIIKTLTLLLALTMLAACGTSNAGNEAGVGEVGMTEITAESVMVSVTEHDEEVTESVGLANPWTEHDSLEDAIAAVGFDFRIPDTISDLAPSAFRTMEGILEVIYETPEDSESSYLCFTLRKGADETDISGDYNTYEQVQQGSHPISPEESVEYTIRGNGDVYSAADWVQDGHFYSVLAEGIETILPPENAVDEFPAWWIMEIISDNLIALNNEEPTALERETESLPPYVYPGEDEQLRAITAYMTQSGTEYLVEDGVNGSGAVAIPAPVIFKTEQIDDTHAKVWGNFWVLNYKLDGTVLLCVSGGENPGIMTLEKSGDSWLVTDAEYAGDGDLYAEDIRRFCDGDIVLESEYFSANWASSEKVQSVRTQFIADYVQANGLNVTAYQDQGWDPIELTDG